MTHQKARLTLEARSLRVHAGRLSRPACTRALLPLLALCAGLAAASAALGQTKEDAVFQAVAALRQHPDDDAARQSLRRAFTEVYPARLPSDVLTYLPASFAQRCEDSPTASAAPQHSFFVTALAFPDAQHRRDPAGLQAFNRAMHGYAQDAATGEWRLRFRVLYHAGDDGAEALARQVMRDLLRVCAVHSAFLGDAGRKLPIPINAWLCSNGDGGAEENGGSLYLLGTAGRHDPMELLRQVAHEFGHLALPPIGPLADPEPWGNGFLGEALYLRWLSRAPAPADTPVPAETLQAYVRREIDPLVKAFADAGAAGLAGHEKDTQGLRLLIGMVLQREDAHGTPAVAQLLRAVRGTTAADWLAARGDR